MDEAFSALDPLIRQDMQHELVALQQRVKKTIVFITHDLDEALKIGDRVILMKDGRVVQIGTPEDILTSPANAYVERFVENVDKAKVLTAQSILAKYRVVAYPHDGPHLALHKMQEESISSIFVVKRDYTLEGIVEAETASLAIEQGKKTIESVIERHVPSVSLTAPLTELITIMAEWRFPVPVVDEQRKLLGIVVRGGVLAALAGGVMKS
jgi:glycine betaine/proline transport system ATP-binding protein